MRHARNIVRTVRNSKALWIPVIWLFLAGSRPLSLWLHIQVAGSSTLDQLEGSPVDRAVFAALIACALGVLVARRRETAALLRVNAPILVFLLYCGLSVLWSDFPDAAFKRWIRAVGDIAMVMVVLTDRSPSAAVKNFLARVGFLIVPLSILLDIWRQSTGREYHFGLTMSKNMFGEIAMILGLASLWRFLIVLWSDQRKNRSKDLIVHGSMVAMATWCLWTAASAAATGCFLLGSILVFATSRWPLARKPALVHLLVASVLFLAVYTLVVNPHVGVVSTMGKDPTLTGRTDIWSAVIELNPNPWFGAGFESFWLGPRLAKLWHVFVWHPNEAHNGYIEVFLNLGWTGLILLGVVIATGYWRIVARLRQGRGMATLMLAYFVVALVYSLAEAGFRIFNPMEIVFFAVTMAVPAVVAQQAAESRHAERLRHWPQGTAQVLVPAGQPPRLWDAE